MLRFRNHALIGILLLAFISCTIIKDSDITSLAELNALSLKSFEIVQNSQVGNSSSLAILKYDSVVNRISGGTGAHVSRVVGFSLPALGNQKIWLRGASNTSTEVTIGYKDNGMPNAFVVYQGDSVVQAYKFFYNTSNQLIKFVTFIDSVDNKPPLLRIRDSIIYKGETYPSQIIRKSSNPSLAGTFKMFGCTGCSGASSSVSGAGFYFNQFGQQLNQQTYNLNYYSNCNNSGDAYPYSCGSVNNTSSINGGGGPNGSQPNVTFQNNFTFNKTLETILTSGSNTDRYYFHPIMILKDVVPQGSFYFWFYSIDWFKTDATTNNNSDMVKINFNYGQ